jgi:hypothetical protein
MDSYNAPSLNGANTVKSPVACGFSGIVARFCLSFCGTVFVIGNGGPAASIRAALAPVVALCVSSLEYVGRLQKAVRGFCVAPRKEAHVKSLWPVVAASLASCAVAPICATHGRATALCMEASGALSPRE